MPFPVVPLALMGGAAIAGGLRSAFSKSGKFKQIPTMSPGSVKALQWASQRGMNQIQNPYAGFDPIANRANAVFRENLLPRAAENWQAMNGQGNDLSSGTFGSQLGAAQRSFGNDLAAMQAQYGQQSMQQGANLLNIGTKPTFENAFFPARDTWLSGALGQAGNAAGMMGAASGMQWLDDYMNTPAAAGNTQSATAPATPDTSAAKTEWELRDESLRQNATNQFAGQAGNPYNYWAAPQQMPTTQKGMAWNSMVNNAGNPFYGWNPSMPVGGAPQWYPTNASRLRQQFLRPGPANALSYESAPFYGSY